MPASEFTLKLLLSTMDTSSYPSTFDAALDEPVLSYDDNVAYEEQVAPAPSLSTRIGSTKVYLLSESSTSGKVHVVVVF